MTLIQLDMSYSTTKSRLTSPPVFALNNIPDISPDHDVPGTMLLSTVNSMLPGVYFTSKSVFCIFPSVSMSFSGVNV